MVKTYIVRLTAYDRAEVWVSKGEALISPVGNYHSSIVPVKDLRAKLLELKKSMLESRQCFTMSNKLEFKFQNSF